MPPNKKIPDTTFFSANNAGGHVLGASAKSEQHGRLRDWSRTLNHAIGGHGALCHSLAIRETNLYEWAMVRVWVAVRSGGVAFKKCFRTDDTRP